MADLKGRLTLNVAGVDYAGDVTLSPVAAPAPSPTPSPTPTPVPSPTPSPAVGLPAVGIAMEPALSPAAGSVPGGTRLSVRTITAPTTGGRTSDPTFPGVQIRRLLPRYVHDYSQLQVFSPDQQLVLLGNEVGYGLYRYQDLSKVRDGTGWLSPRWLPDGRILYLAGEPYRLVAHNPATGTEEVLFSSSFPYGYTAQVHEEASEDGRWTAGMGHRGGGADLTVFAVDLVAKSFGASINVPKLFADGTAKPDPEWGIPEIDWARATPSGKYLAIQWAREDAQRASGLELYDIRTGAFVRQVHQHHAHGDFGISPDGREFYATNHIAHPANSSYPGIAVEWLEGGLPTYLRMTDWFAFAHISARGPRGQLLVSAEHARGTGAQNPLVGELWLMDFSGATRRLAHHRSTESGGDPASYWSQARASLSRDGRRAIFDSDWGRAGDAGVFALEF